MSFRWVVDQEHPQGHLVEMTAAEEAQLATDQAAGAAESAADAILDGNRAAILAAMNTRMAKIRTARTAIGNGNLFASLSVNEKAVIDGLLEDDLYMGRLVLNLFDGVS